MNRKYQEKYEHKANSHEMGAFAKFLTKFSKSFYLLDILQG